MPAWAGLKSLEGPGSALALAGRGNLCLLQRGWQLSWDLGSCPRFTAPQGSIPFQRRVRGRAIGQGVLEQEWDGREG